MWCGVGMGVGMGVGVGVGVGEGVRVVWCGGGVAWHGVAWRGRRKVRTFPGSAGCCWAGWLYIAAPRSLYKANCLNPDEPFAPYEQCPGFSPEAMLCVTHPVLTPLCCRACPTCAL